jgi:hypothetical protein
VGAIIVKKAAAEHAENGRYSRKLHEEISAALRQFRVFRGCCCCSSRIDHAARRTATQLFSSKNNASSTAMPGEQRDDASPPQAA